MSNNVNHHFKLLIDSLNDEGWNDDIIDDVRILQKRYIKERC